MNLVFISYIVKQLNNEKVTPLIHKSNSLSSNHDYTPALSFAWEEGTESNLVIQNAITAMTATKTLVVIGYSFPNFNREIDKLFLGENCAQWIEKIYVQDKNPDEIIEKIKEYRRFDYQRKMWYLNRSEI